MSFAPLLVANLILLLLHTMNPYTKDDLVNFIYDFLTIFGASDRLDHSLENPHGEAVLAADLSTASGRTAA